MSNQSFVVVTNTLKDGLGLGDYLRIISILENLNFNNFVWISDKCIHNLVSEAEIINEVYELGSINAKKYLNSINFIFNLYEKNINKYNSSNYLYLSDVLDKGVNIKDRSVDMCKKVSDFFKIENYKVFSNKKIYLNNNDIFFNHIVPDDWKIKEFPLQKLKNLEKKIKKHIPSIKIQWQSQTDTLEQYINKIKYSKIIISIIGLGVHLGILYNKKLIILAGPTFFTDINKYDNKHILNPKLKCECQTKLINTGIACKLHTKYSCMNEIDEDEIFKKIIEELS